MEKELAEALENVSDSKGMVCTANKEHELGTQIKYLNDYLVVGVFAELLKQKKVEIIFRHGREDRDVNYLLKLLKSEDIKEIKQCILCGKKYIGKGKSWFGTCDDCKTKMMRIDEMDIDEILKEGK